MIPSLVSFSSISLGLVVYTKNIKELVHAAERKNKKHTWWDPPRNAGCLKYIEYGWPNGLKATY